MTNLLAAINYFPAAGLQIVTSLGSLLTKNNFAKFCGIQSIVYNLLVIIVMIVYAFADIILGVTNIYPFNLILPLFIMVFILLTPIIQIYLAFKAYYGVPIYFPIIGRSIAKFVKYDGDQK